MFRGEELVVAKLLKKFSIFHDTSMLIACSSTFRVPAFCTGNDKFDVILTVHRR